MEKFVSLYDYLGKPAGKELGRQVNIAAKSSKIPTQKRYVANAKYRGEVILYPENWLAGYFQVVPAGTGTAVPIDVENLAL